MTSEYVAPIEILINCSYRCDDDDIPSQKSLKRLFYPKIFRLLTSLLSPLTTMEEPNLPAESDDFNKWIISLLGIAHCMYPNVVTKCEWCKEEISFDYNMGLCT